MSGRGKSINPDKRANPPEFIGPGTSVGKIAQWNGLEWEPFDLTAFVQNLINSTVISGSGSVTSVGLSMPKEFGAVSGSPVMGAGTLTVTWTVEGVNTFFAGPSSGGSATPGFRAISPNDILATTAGAPVDTPSERTARFDPATGKLYIYDGAVWKSVTLT